MTSALLLRGYSSVEYRRKFFVFNLFYELTLR